jgi:hypothetical protein
MKRKRKVAHLQMILDSTRSTDDDVDARPQRALLRLVRRAAVHAERLQRGAIVLKLLRDLSKCTRTILQLHSSLAPAKKKQHRRRAWMASSRVGHMQITRGTRPFTSGVLPLLAIIRSTTGST